MLKYIFFLFFILGVNLVNGQEFAYIDSEYILKNVPEYVQAKEKLDGLATKWTKEVEDRYAAIKAKKANFDREEVLLPAEEKEKRKSEIDKLEKETIELQTQHFGSNGDYFQKRQELVKPIQDKVFDAMQKIASKKNYAFIFDKSNQSTLVYGDKKSDLSDEVIKELGIK